MAKFKRASSSLEDSRLLSLLLSNTQRIIRLGLFDFQMAEKISFGNGGE